jgi:hypothetical protein
MTTQPDIKETINSLLNRGFEVPDIKDHLRKTGHPDPDIDQAFLEVDAEREADPEAVTPQRGMQGFIWMVTGFLALLVIAIDYDRIKPKETIWTIVLVAIFIIARGIYIATRPLKRGKKK